MTDSGETPTATVRRVDMSTSGPRASAPPLTSSQREAALFSAYRFPAPVIVQHDCACGGVIRAEMGDWGQVASAIRCHQELTIHWLWRKAHGL